MSKNSTVPDNFSYDKAMKELTTIVQALQNDEISIDKLSEKIKRASELIALCREKLRQTESDIESVFNE